MASTCPAGHPSTATDYCDVCGLPIPDVVEGPGAGGGSAAAGAAPAAVAELDPDAASSGGGEAGVCPHCAAVNPVDALFCEACGYDFTTGTPPRAPAPPPTAAPPAAAPPQEPVGAPATAPPSLAPPIPTPWVAEIWIDPDWYTDQQSSDPLPSAGVPTVVPLRTTSVLVGRSSRSRGIHPDVDLGADTGISRRHCQLTTDGTRWWVEDLGSSNGTFVGSALGPLPSQPVPPGERREVGVDDRIYLGAWTRVVLRRAQPGEA